MSKFFTSDWHIGEQATPNTDSFLRPRPTEVMAEEWLVQCEAIIKPDDDLYLLGDLAITLDDWEFYKRLPKCKIHIICGDKETGGKNYDFQALDRKIREEFDNVVYFTAECGFVEIGGMSWRMEHKPEELLRYALYMPSLCGHVHGIWRTQCMPNGEPIINVSIDAWGGLVTEEHIMHQYNAIKKGYYDRNARVDQW